MGRREPLDRFKARLRGVIAEERDIGYLDPGIEPLLDKLNSVEGLATTSTCIGRISVVEGREPWERGEGAARIVYKTHGRLTVERLQQYLDGRYCWLWLRVSPPILHVRAWSMECALHLLALARRAGFKHSGIISHGGEAGIVVEIISGAQFTAPLILSCVRAVNLSPRALTQLVEIANGTVEENRDRLERLVESVTRDPGPCGSPETA